MSEPIITPAAVYTFGGVATAGSLLGMPVDAVVLGAIASATVTMVTEPKTRWLVVCYTIIGGLLGGALAPPLVHLWIGESAARYPSLAEYRVQFAHVFAPVLVGLMWQLALKCLLVLWPSFERNADNIVEWLLNLLPWRHRK
ncbi:hypothetical protein V9W64_00010 [Neisseria leonii]|uniref:Uncharacterized protein n=1 Tax=Neisseria leonii TaxID=2995413 RepID=A0A9X4E1C0_9NEIS|nr:hypothetical protein [Neisseria sp. 51.81]MDD9326760.1 hypothetical protein [Neisseria sp. 51.81]